jgi:NADPH:quinone reductase-like Zn-dependent oxidoreductase
MIVGGGDQGLAAAAEAAGVRLVRHLVHPDGPGLVRLAELAGGGGLRVVVEQLLPLEQASQAHRLGERGRTRGKIVLAAAP